MQLQLDTSETWQEKTKQYNNCAAQSKQKHHSTNGYNVIKTASVSGCLIGASMRVRFQCYFQVVFILLSFYKRERQQTAAATAKMEKI